MSGSMYTSDSVEENDVKPQQENMKLWLVQRADWYYDCLSGALVRACTEAEARRLVSLESGDEGAKAWFKKSTRCIEVKAEGKSEVILRDFKNG